MRRIAILLIALAAQAARAQGPVPVPPCTTARVVQVALPGATCAAVSEASRIAVFSHPAPADHALTVVPLDPAGAVEAGPASRIPLAEPDSLRDYTVYAIGMVFHPRLPLLYVWRDVAFTGKVRKGNEHPVYRDFDHLQVYAVSNRTLVPAGAFARGPAHAFHAEWGSLALDPQGRRLFVPNLRAGKDGAAQGYLPLGTNGLPLEADGKLMLVKTEPSEFFTLPTGRGFAPFNERILLAGAVSGIVVWDTGNRLASLSRMLLPGSPGQVLFLGAHPAVPAVYAGSGSFLAMVAVADGYPTLMPTAKAAPGLTVLAPPVVLPADPACVAVGGVNGIHVLGIEKGTGRFDGRDSVVPVSNKAVRALAASAAWNRLYVAVEALP